MGGSTTTLVRKPDVKAMVVQPSAKEQIVAQQDDSLHSHRVYLMPSADVRRGDELRGNGQKFRVVSVVQPSTPNYSKAFVELIQPEGS